jgi:ubiquinone/menaquinone biosynthesis C-methylase UbiE
MRHSNLIDCLNLWRISKQRLSSEENYRAFQVFQAQKLLTYLERHGVSIHDRILMDLGSGVGGYSQEFSRHSAKVISVDLIQPNLTTTHPVKQIKASALHIPFEDCSIEIVFCASLVEHVPEPGLLLSEIERILRPRGFAYLSFPPFYSPMGGHEYAPYHYLGERLAMRLSSRGKRQPEWTRQLYKIPENKQSFSEMYAGWGLYKMTIKKFRALVAKTGLSYIDISTRYFPFSFIRWPLIGEILTWHAQFILVKPPSNLDAAYS